MKPNKIVDLIFLSLLGLLIILTVVRHYQFSSILSLNNYLGFTIWSFLVINRGLKVSLPSYSILVILILFTFNIVNFTVEIFEARIGIESRPDLTFNSLSVNPVGFLLFLIYSIINRGFFRSLIKDLLNGTAEEQALEAKKAVSFYFEKFKDYNEEEFNKVVGNLNEYPEEAQIAIKRIINNK
jgi:hypothetical protein